MRRAASSRPTICAPVLIGKTKSLTRLPGGDATIKAPAALMQKIVELCDGSRLRKDIEGALSAEWNVSDVNALLDALEQNGAIVDTHTAALAALKLIANRPKSSKNIADDIASVTTVGAVPVSARAVFVARHLDPLKTTRSALAGNRRSMPAFTGQAVEFAKVLTILQASHDSATSISRKIPFPLHVYYIAMSPTPELAQGIHRVRLDVAGRVGLRRTSPHWQQAYRAYADPEILRFACGVIVVCADFSKHLEKPAHKLLQDAMLETEHAIRNALLAAKENKIAALAMAVFMSDQLEIMCRLKKGVIPLSTIVIGTAAPKNSRKQKKTPAFSFQWIDFDHGHRPHFFLGAARIDDREKKAGMCWGRDPDPLTAHDKAVAEAFERLACTTPSKLVPGIFHDWTHAIDPRTVIAYSSRQYVRNARRLHPFDPQRKYLWKQGQNLTSGHAVHVPADLVYYGAKLRTLLGKHRYTWANSSGAAAHTNPQSALERALLELVERDAFMRTWLHRLPTPRIPHRALPGKIQERLRYAGTLGANTVIKVLPSRFAACVLVFLQLAEQGRTIVATAADYRLEDALDNALMEAESMLLLPPDEGTKGKLHPSEVRTPKDHGRLYMQRRYFRSADFLRKGNATIRLATQKGQPKNLTMLTDQLLSRFDRIVQFDLTPAANAALGQGRIPLYVVRAIVPGLVPMTFGYDLEPLLPSIGNPARRDARKIRNPLFPHPFL